MKGTKNYEKVCKFIFIFSINLLLDKAAYVWKAHVLCGEFCPCSQDLFIYFIKAELMLLGSVTYTGAEITNWTEALPCRGPCQFNFFHKGCVVTALYLCFLLTALTSSRHVKSSKNKVKEGRTSSWCKTWRRLVSKTCTYVHVSVCLCECRQLCCDLYGNVLMLALTSSPPGLMHPHVEIHPCLIGKFKTVDTQKNPSH